MNLARVIGTVWATRKDEALAGRRMLILQPMAFDGGDSSAPTVALDTVDAGVGDVVLYVTSTEAAVPFPGLTPTDATVVGIVERVDHQTGTWTTAHGTAGEDRG